MFFWGSSSGLKKGSSLAIALVPYRLTLLPAEFQP